MPRLDWRRSQTWSVFLGLGLALAFAATIVAVLYAIAVELVIQGQIPRILVGTPIVFTICLIGYFALIRATPLRDTEDRPLPGNPRPDLVMLPLVLLLTVPWLTGFFVVSLQTVLLVRDLTGVFSEQLPIWALSVVGFFSIMVFEVPFRVLWRAPVQEPNRHE